MLRPLFVSAITLSTLAAASACSSSSSKGAPAVDSGTSDSGTADGDSSTGPSGDSGVDAGPCPANTPYTASAYVDVTGHQGVCTAADVSAFEAACGDNTTPSECDAWLAANVGLDGGSGTACGNCIVPPNAQGTGGASFESIDAAGHRFFAPNYPGCVQLLDPTSGPACAKAQAQLYACVSLECDDCDRAVPPYYESSLCMGEATGVGAVCEAYENLLETSCNSDDGDGGAEDMCSPGNGAGVNADWTFIINLICGS